MLKFFSKKLSPHSFIFTQFYLNSYCPHNAISPLDGRYNKSVMALNPYFS